MTTCAAGALQEAAERLGRGETEVVMDFSSVLRVDAREVRTLAELARTAEEKSAHIAIRGVNMDIYKVLKLVKLAGRFRYLN